MKYLIPILLLLSSCRTVNKLFHKDKEKIDSTVVTHNVSIEEKHIDTTKTQTISSQKENSVEVDLGNDTTYYSTPKRHGDGWGYIDSLRQAQKNEPYYNATTIHDYFVSIDRKTGKITSNQPITHVTIKGIDEIKYSNFTGGIDSSVLKNDLAESTHIQKQVLKVDGSVSKKVAFSTVIYWGIGILIFLIILYIIYRNRDKIFTLLKIPPI